ncbi:hypothetical protein BJX70DRAFT_350237 [Aspergillus crustosus]
MFQQLPPEIQLLVAQQLDCTSATAALALTSHHFHDLATPILYKNLENTYTHDILRLVDTLARNPSLRGFPRSLKLEAWDPVPLETGEDALTRVPVDPEEEEQDYWAYRIGLLCRLAKAACPSQNENEEEGDAWARDIRLENVDAWLALLLTLMPNLVRFEVQFPMTGRWVQRVVEWAVHGQVSALQSVQEVYVSARWFEFQGEIQNVTQWTLMFMGLPSVCRIATDGLSGDEVEDKTETTTAIKSPSSVTHITIDHCKGVRNLDKLIRNCPKLHSYRHHYAPQSSRKHILNPRGFYPALLIARCTLKELWLDIFPTYVIDSDDGVHWPSFSDFTVLELLHVPHFLLGQYPKNPPTNIRGTLPSSLKTLHITEVDKVTLAPILKSLLDCISDAPANVHFDELIIATMGALTRRDAIMAAVEMDSDSRRPGLKLKLALALTAAERSAPAIRHAAELYSLCCQRGTRFGVHKGQSKYLERWETVDPFEETR